MVYNVIFTTGYDDDSESLTRQLRGDVLINDSLGNLYRPFFITLNRINIEFDKDDVCYLEDNLVILHSVTKENILKAAVKLHKWQFYNSWIPASEEEINKFVGSKENWVTFEIEVE